MRLDNEVTLLEERLKRLNNLVRKSNKVTEAGQKSSDCYPVNGKIKTKKCQPAAGDTPDLIQTECVTDSRLALPTKKYPNIKIQKKKKILTLQMLLLLISTCAQDHHLSHQSWKIVRTGNMKLKVELIPA